MRLLALATLASLLLAACGGDPEPADDALAPAPLGAESSDKLCAVTAKWAPTLAQATDLAETTAAKIGYLSEARVVAPTSWADNIDLILPAWLTLEEVIAAAGGDASRIDFEKFLTDFAEATANDSALDAYTGALCPNGQ